MTKTVKTLLLGSLSMLVLQGRALAANDLK